MLHSSHYCNKEGMETSDLLFSKQIVTRNYVIQWQSEPKLICSCQVVQVSARMYQ